MLHLTLAFIVALAGANPSRTPAPKLFREKAFSCATLAEAVNHFVGLGEKAAIKKLESQVLDWHADADFKLGFSTNERIGWVCRILFQPKGNEPLRDPAFGGLSLPSNSMPFTRWPLYPLARSGSTYFVLSEGYWLAGWPEDPKEYLKYCRTEGKFRTERIQVPTRRQALKDLEQLRQSEAWKAIKWRDSGPGFSTEISEDWIWGFIKAQADLTPEK